MCYQPHIQISWMWRTWWNVCRVQHLFDQKCSIFYILNRFVFEQCVNRSALLFLNSYFSSPLHPLWGSQGGCLMLMPIPAAYGQVGQGKPLDEGPTVGLELFLHPVPDRLSYHHPNLHCELNKLVRHLGSQSISVRNKRGYASSRIAFTVQSGLNGVRFKAEKKLLWDSLKKQYLHSQTFIRNPCCWYCKQNDDTMSRLTLSD